MSFWTPRGCAKCPISDHKHPHECPKSIREAVFDSREPSGDPLEGPNDIREDAKLIREDATDTREDPRILVDVREHSRMSRDPRRCPRILAGVRESSRMSGDVRKCTLWKLIGGSKAWFTRRRGDAEVPAQSHATLLREGQADADGRAAARCRVDLEISSSECDALLHAQQALAGALNGALARGWYIVAATVIAHDELQGAVGLTELDLDEARLRVTDDIRQRLLRDAKAGHLHGGRRPPPEVSDGQAERQSGAFRLVLHVPLQRLLEPELVEQRRAEGLSEIAHAGDGAVEQLDAVGTIVLQSVKVELESGEHLPEVIVELAGNPASLCLLRLDQLARQRLQLLRSSPQLLLGALALRDIGIGSKRAQGPAGLVADDRGAAEDPVDT